MKAQVVLRDNKEMDFWRTCVINLGSIYHSAGANELMLVEIH